MIKGVGKQGVASIASIFCMFIVGLPLSWLFGIKLGFGLPGLWVGYGLCSLSLAILYTWILRRLNWSEAAYKAS